MARLSLAASLIKGLCSRSRLAADRPDQKTPWHGGMGRYPEKNQPHAKFTCVPSPRVARNLRGAILLQTVMATSPSQCRFSKLRLCWGKWIILWIAASALGHSMMFAAETQASAGNKLASDPASFSPSTARNATRDQGTRASFRSRVSRRITPTERTANSG